MDNQPLTAAQRSSEWYAQRLGKVTASRVADCMSYYRQTKAEIAAGAPPRETAARKSYREGIVAERITGMPNDPEPYTSYDMKWGIANEAIARNVYQLNYRRLVEDAPFVQHEKLLCGASPDGYVVDTTTGELGLIEIKCLRTSNHLYKTIMTQEVPQDYIPQIQMQLWITGRQWCDFIAYDSRVPEGLKIFVKRLERDEEYIKNLEAEVRKFLDECERDFKHFWAKVKNNKGETKDENMGRKSIEAVAGEKTPRAQA